MEAELSRRWESTRDLADGAHRRSARRGLRPKSIKSNCEGGRSRPACSARSSAQSHRRPTPGSRPALTGRKIDGIIGEQTILFDDQRNHHVLVDEIQRVADKAGEDQNPRTARRVESSWRRTAAKTPIRTQSTEQQSRQNRFGVAVGHRERGAQPSVARNMRHVLGADCPVLIEDDAGQQPRNVSDLQLDADRGRAKSLVRQRRDDRRIAAIAQNR